MNLQKISLIAIATLALAVVATPAAKADLVLNGGFESNGGNGQINYNTFATNWSVPGNANQSYTFLFGPGTADTTGANGVYGNVSLWGPGNGVPNGMPATSPNGGYFVAQDPVFQTSPIQQTITGLTAGNQYTLSFYYAGAQQAPNWFGPTTEGWQVSLGSDTQSTPLLSNASQGFTGWQYQTMTFTADGSSDVLSFLALGSPSGLPPFALLDGVSLNAANPVPEPATLTLLSIGLVSLGAYRLRRARAATV